jgi:ribonuclease P protein component
MKFSYSKVEKLKSRKTIESLFTEGKSLGVFPLRLFYIEIPQSETAITKTAVSVSKKNFRLAVHRIKIKRLLREAFRLNKHLILENTSKKYALLFLYVGKEMPHFHQLDASIKKLMNKFIEQTKN